MAPPLVLTLLRKLLDVCRQWSGRALPLLLKLFSVFVRCLSPRRLYGSSELPRGNNKAGSLEVGDSQTSDNDNRVGTRRPSSLPSYERGVVLACSSMPPVPTTLPQVRIRQHARSIDSYASYPRSPTSTLRSSSPYLSDDDRCYALPLDVIGEGSIMEGALSAEPGAFDASPTGLKSKPVKTIAPSERPRYDRNIAIKSIETSWIFKSLGTFDVYRNQDVGSWKHYVHPEGPPYYLLKNSGIHNFSYLTEAHLQDNDVLEEVQAFMNAIENHAENFDWGGKVPENVEVVLEIQDEDWSYYMADLDRRCIFWLHDYDISGALGEGFGVESLEHFRNQLDFEFWQHIEYFPNHRELYPDIFSEVMGVLNYWRIDLKTSADSAAPYDADDFDSLVVSVKHLQAVYDSGHNAAYAVASVARLMGLIFNERHMNFYGFNGARLSVWQSVRGDVPKKRSALIKCLSPLLFYAPETHLSGLERLWVDGVIRDRRWKKYQYKLERDWESFVLTSTVLLNANVALLSTPIVLSGNGNGVLWASPAAVASQVSIVASIASIVVGLLLVRQIRISGKDIEVTPTDTINYLSNRKHKQLGLETIAIQYSLPYALLMWGMITFLTSIAIACFFRVDETPGTISQLIYAVSWLFAVPLILWTVITGWETNNQTHWTQLLSADWWKSVIHLRCERPSKKPWTWRVTRRPKDLEADQVTGSEEDTAADSDRKSEPSTQPMAPKVPNNRNWRVRVKNFGPVRRLTFNSFTRS